MTLETKISYVTAGKWTKPEALACWSRYHTLYEVKHGGALHNALMNGNADGYIKKECDTFRRYARMWHYKTHKQNGFTVDASIYNKPKVRGWGV